MNSWSEKKITILAKNQVLEKKITILGEKKLLKITKIYQKILKFAQKIKYPLLDNKYCEIEKVSDRILIYTKMYP